MFTLVHVAGNKLDFNVLNRQKKIAPCCRLLPSVKLPSVGFCHSAWLSALEIRGLMQRGMLGKKNVYPEQEPPRQMPLENLEHGYSSKRA